MKKKIILAADNITGVYHIGKIPTGEFIYIDDDFRKALPSVKDSEIIYGSVSIEIAKKIKTEYGITRG